MPEKTFDVIVVGTGAGGGTAMKMLCEGGLSVCAINSGPRTQPEKDFKLHRQVYDLKYRGYGDPMRHAGKAHQEPYSVEESEYSDGRVCLNTMSLIPMARARTGIGSAVSRRAGRRIFGGVLPPATETLISRRRNWTDSVRTGRSPMRTLRRGFRKPRSTWAWPARFRIARVILTASIYRRCRSVA